MKSVVISEENGEIQGTWRRVGVCHRHEIDQKKYCFHVNSDTPSIVPAASSDIKAGLALCCRQGHVCSHGGSRSG